VAIIVIWPTQMMMLWMETNPAPVDRWFIPLFAWFQPSKVVQDLFHLAMTTIQYGFVWTCSEIHPNFPTCWPTWPPKSCTSNLRFPLICGTDLAYLRILRYLQFANLPRPFFLSAKIGHNFVPKVKLLTTSRGQGDF
jgi:hypothetical protein